MRITVIIKYPALLLLSIVGFVKINAQTRLAAYGGMHAANVIENNNIPGWLTDTKKNYSSRTGFHLGVMLEIPIGNRGFYFQPGIGYSSKGRQFQKLYDTSLSAKDTLYIQNTLKLGYIELPLNITYKIPISSNRKNSFFISAGPYLSFFYSGKSSQQSRILASGSTDKYEYQSGDVDLGVGNGPDKYKTFDMGINAKAGFEFGNVMISGFYSRGLTNFYTATYNGTFHHELIGATLGIWLSKGQPPVAKIVKDSDKDGIPDDEDACPLQPGTVTWHGCPVPDTDHDGIDDEHDSCRTIAGPLKYHGCPVPDTDGDGIDDDNDFCKTVPGVLKYHGCPVPDTDSDGINDDEDKCPNEPGNPDNHGCPVIKQEITKKVNYTAKHIMFESSSMKLTRSSYSALSELAATMKAHPELHLTIEGYTDSTGAPSHNMQLSLQRANAVKSYLIKKGISNDQITANGYGQQKPIGDNKTLKGKAMNRRVEFKLEYRQ